MKKRIIVGLVMVGMLMVTGCGQSGADTNPALVISEDEIQPVVTTDTERTADTERENVNGIDDQTSDIDSSGDTGEPAGVGSSSDTLVVYFSRTGEQYGVGVIEKGNTAIVADMIVEQTGADIFEILPQEDYYPYTYDELTDVAKKELNENARPAYAGEIPDLSQYSTIFIGAPVWWGDWPMIMYTFFEENEDALAGKTLIPFSTHAGSGLSGFDRKLSGACPNSTVGTGLAIAGTDTQNDPDSVRKSVNDWLSGFGY